MVLHGVSDAVLNNKGMRISSRSIRRAIEDRLVVGVLALWTFQKVKSTLEARKEPRENHL